MNAKRFEFWSYNHDGWEHERHRDSDDLGEILLAAMKVQQPHAVRDSWYYNQVAIKFQGKVLFTIHKEGARAFYPTL